MRSRNVAIAGTTYSHHRGSPQTAAAAPILLIIQAFASDEYETSVNVAWRPDQSQTATLH